MKHIKVKEVYLKSECFVKLNYADINFLFRIRVGNIKRVYSSIRLYF